MNATKASSILACALLCAASGLAYAGSVDFHVNLDVRSYPAPNLEVWCELRSAQGQPIEAGMSVLKVNGGAVSGFAKVMVNYQPQEAAIIRNYLCALVVESKSSLGGGLGSGREGMGSAKSIPRGATILQSVGGPLQ